MALDYSDLMEIIETEVRNFIEAKIPDFCSRVCEEYDQIDPESLEDLTRDFFLEGGGGATIEPKKIPTLPQSAIKTSAAVTSATLASSGLNDDQCTAMTAKKQRCKHKRKPGSLFCTSHSSKATTSGGEAGISSSLVAADQIKVLKYGEKDYIYNRISFDIYAMPVGGIGMVSEAGNQINISKLQHVGIMRGSQVIFEGEVETAPQPYQINQTLPETQKSILTTTPKLGSGVPAIVPQIASQIPVPVVAPQIQMPQIAPQMPMPQIAPQMPMPQMPNISMPINLSGVKLPNL